MRRRSRLLFLVAVVTCAGSTAARAQGVQIGLKGRVVYVDDQSDALRDAVAVDTVVRATYAYDLSTPDSSPLAHYASYRHREASHGIVIDAGGVLLQTDPNDADFLIEISNDAPPDPLRDAYAVRSYSNLPLPSGAAVDTISWLLTDATATAVDSTALTAEPPSLDAWLSSSGVAVEGEGRERFFIRVQVDAAWLCSAVAPCPSIGSGSAMAADLGPNGLWFYEDHAWRGQTLQDPRDLLYWRNGVVVGFPPNGGLWFYDHFDGWEQLAELAEEDVVVWRGNLVVDFGSVGLWIHDGASWTGLTSADAVALSSLGKELAVSFGDDLGIWIYDGVDWTQTATATAEKIEPLR